MKQETPTALWASGIAPDPQRDVSLLRKVTGSGDKPREPCRGAFQDVSGEGSKWQGCELWQGLQGPDPKVFNTNFFLEALCRVLGGSQPAAESLILMVDTLDNFTQPQPLYLQNGDNDRICCMMA